MARIPPHPTCCHLSSPRSSPIFPFQASTPLSFHIYTPNPTHRSRDIEVSICPSLFRPISTLMGHFLTLVSYLHSLAGPSIMLLYPLYASICAIESPSKLDDEQWLAYWILYSFLTLMEMVAQPILSWIPIWFQLKVAFVAWLVLPQFRGASFIYERFVREQLRKHGVKLIGAPHPPPKKTEEEVGQ